MINQNVKKCIDNWTKEGKCPVYEGWPKNLFRQAGKEGTAKITQFIKKRFYATADFIEYYFCMPYLKCEIEPDLLYVHWNDSPNKKGRMEKRDSNNQLDFFFQNGLISSSLVASSI
ncbi:hypothetical protein J2755_001612 [Methanohalophilus levihalophilus]|uniref:hypothetical protein n=1 Tax=Methanohalophilus levihalophilus TaxID=1431282 RepID=UPI001AEB4284|nr:hypothetical protein [Methanohalophilus levihalophilus]MBP2030664.1 hypothetical protein [Methanohalophilus levihalophilus]